MLGYSDSNKESGLRRRELAPLPRAGAPRRGGATGTASSSRSSTVAAARSDAAAGRRTGRSSRRRPGSIDGRLKLTEQGEVLAAKYADRAVAEHELELVANAVLRASTPERDAAIEAAAADGRAMMDEMADAALARVPGARVGGPGVRGVVPRRDADRRALRAAPGVATGRRGAWRRPRRAGAPVSAVGPISAGEPISAGIAALRAIPWVFAWTQARIELPGWFGLGTALADQVARHGEAGIDRLAHLYRSWPFFGTLLDSAEASLARVEPGTSRAHARLADERPRRAHGSRRRILAEYERTLALLLRVTGRTRLLDDAARDPARRSPCGRRTSTRSPSSRCACWSGSGDAPRTTREAVRIGRIVQTTVSGLAAGLQTTG